MQFLILKSLALFLLTFAEGTLIETAESSKYEMSLWYGVNDPYSYGEGEGRIMGVECD